MMSDKASVFETVSARILSLALEFGAEMVDEVDVHSVSGVVLEFLSLHPVSLRSRRL